MLDHSSLFFSLRRAARLEAHGVLGAGAFVALILGAGCSSSNAASQPPHADAAAAAVCPLTPEDTIGVHCTAEGLTCGPQYSCGSTAASLLCVCTEGTFQCRDGKGNVLNAGDTPSCGSSAAAAPACPASEKAASFAPCATVGQICAYPSACPTMLDICNCYAGTTVAGTNGKVFSCTHAVCGMDAAAPPAFDAGATAPDANSTPDADLDTDADSIQDASPVDAKGDHH